MPHRPLPHVLTAAATTTLLVLTSALALTAAPAHAAVSGTTSASDQTLTNSCRRIPIDYRLRVDPGTTQWQLRIKVESPDGDAPEGFDLSSDAGDALQGTLRYLLCGSDNPGTYTVQGSGTYQAGLPLANVAFELTDSTFDVRRQPTRTGIAARPLPGPRTRLVATVKAERRGTFQRVGNAPVRLQRKADGRWQRVRGSLRLTDAGRVRYVVSLPPGTRVRAVTAAQGFRGRSVSPAVRLGR